MAVNVPSAYGTDLRALYDADAFWTACTGLDSVRQDAFHRVTTDDVIGEVGWGYDVRRLLGAKTSELAAAEGLLAQVLLRDLRLMSVDVTLIAVTTRGISDVSVRIAGRTAQGPFPDIVIDSVADLSATVLAGLPTR